MNLTLYHNPMSTCSQKVRMALAEKGVAWTSVEIDLLSREHKGDAYLAINPAGVVPSLKVDDLILVESSLINAYIAEACAGSDLMPKGALQRYNTQLWIKRIDERVHEACGILTYATAMRVIMMQMDPQAVLAEINNITDDHARALRLSLFEQGVDAPAFQSALDRLLDFIASMEGALARDKWLSGASFGLADCAALPYVLRFDHLNLAQIWGGGRLPHVETWLEAVKARPSYETAIVSYLSGPALGMFAAVGSLVEPKLVLG
ncbi:MAG: glutathione S-transferase family protein [Aquidulcibacter sp.]|jgi:glutathione S-transferase|uniref:glutathione S-transferase family protein n=1 Tax=Aquidulcibacter sp. TaxID=2052990 RepID=UPI0022BC92E2|nr:glutathione S-transferase family protein [Aquidulcibacter sp.]MCE2889919.1 glutathione S-transferase family protein [Hyphomonadaceae bacterium]MCZ8209162.1 glutathione S-transferase family protein [Aquidulcibacter sp.]